MGLLVFDQLTWTIKQFPSDAPTLHRNRWPLAYHSPERASWSHPRPVRWRSRSIWTWFGIRVRASERFRSSSADFWIHATFWSVNSIAKLFTRFTVPVTELLNPSMFVLITLLFQATQSRLFLRRESLNSKAKKCGFSMHFFHMWISMWSFVLYI